jgi:hypothetical protein
VENTLSEARKKDEKITFNKKDKKYVEKELTKIFQDKKNKTTDDVKKRLEKSNGGGLRPVAFLFSQAADVIDKIRVLTAQEQRQGPLEVLSAAPLAHAVVPSPPSPTHLHRGGRVAGQAGFQALGVHDKRA